MSAGTKGTSERKRETIDEKKQETSFTDTKGTQKSQLKVSQAAIDKQIQDMLSGTSGLASIFQAENTAGIFNSTGAAAGAGDLTAKIAGEIAKLTGVTETEIDETSRTETESERVQRKKNQDHSFELDTNFGF